MQEHTGRPDEDGPEEGQERPDPARGVGTMGGPPEHPGTEVDEPPGRAQGYAGETVVGRDVGGTPSDTDAQRASEGTDAQPEEERRDRG